MERSDKRHIAVDTNGLPHAIAVTTANVTDQDGAIEMVMNNKTNLSRVKNSLVDGGYSGETFAEAIKELLGVTVEVAKRSELHKFAAIPKRWLVERSLAWLEKCRRLWKNCKRKLALPLLWFNWRLLGCLLEDFRQVLKDGGFWFGKFSSEISLFFLTII